MKIKHMNIIINQTKLLIEISESGYSFPSQHSLKNIEEYLEPILLPNKTDYFLANFVGELPPHLENLAFISYRQVFSSFDAETLDSLAYSWQFTNYYNTHRFCGRCGTPTEVAKNNIFLHCNSCNQEIYPHIAPCIIVLIYNDNNEVLMARNANFPPQMWSLLAGFVEMGETLEEAVKREVKEEVNIEIDNLQYWGSQAWPFPTGSLMVGFTACYKSGIIKVDEIEIIEAGFFNIHQLPGFPTKFSIAHKMLKHFMSKQL